MTEQMKQMIVSLPGFDYIAPVEFAQDISSMQTQELTEFFLKIAKECGYQKVVLEISSAVASQWKMIFACSRVYMPVRQDYICGTGLKKWNCRRIICNLMRRTLEAGREKK